MFLQVCALVLEQGLGTGQDGDVLELLPYLVPETGCLHGYGLDHLAHNVQDEGGQSLSLDVLGHYQEGPLLLYAGLQGR